MKNTKNASILIILLVMLLPILGQSQTLPLCLTDATIQDRFYCLPSKDVINLLSNSEVLICKIDSLENNQTAKNCILKLNDNEFVEAFITSGIDNPEVAYIEFVYCGRGYFIQSTPESREEYFVFWYEVDSLLADMELKEFSQQ